MACPSKEDSQSSDLATFCHAEQGALRIARPSDFLKRSWKDGFLYEMFFQKLCGPNKIICQLYSICGLPV